MKKFILILFLIFNSTNAQWKIGGLFNLKNEIPEKGIGINVSRNIPYQGATFGIKVRAGVDLFRQSETETVNGNSVDRSYRSEDYRIEIIGNYYFKNFSPYYGFGFGYGRINVNQLNKGSFLINLLAGFSIPVNSFINPFIEVQGFNYFSDFDPALSGRDISSFQLRGALGISFLINTLNN